MRTGMAAARWAREQVTHPIKAWPALCLQFVRMCFNVAAREASAKDAWQAAEFKHPTTDANTIPRAVPVFWQIGEFWHVAFSLGKGWCVSTDVRRRGMVNIVRIDAIRTAWGAQLLGWTEDLNGERVWRNKPAAPASAPAPVHTNVSRAREQLRVARRCVAIAERLLSKAPDERTIVHEVADKLDNLDAAIDRRLSKLPAR
jgi:hypothetical protein